MRDATKSVFSFAFLLVLCSLPLQGKDTCKSVQLPNQRRDAATIRRLENAWSRAFLRGDANFERCLLAADYMEVSRTGQLGFLDKELAGAAKNRGKKLPIPTLPKVEVLLHENVAVAYGKSTHTPPGGEPQTTRFEDVFVWQNESWHAVFSQQTPVKKRRK